MMTLNERAEFEHLLEKHTQAGLRMIAAQSALREAEQQRHDALHACIKMIEALQATAAAQALQVPQGGVLPGYSVEHTRTDTAVPYTDCLCIVCNDVRAFRRVLGEPFRITVPSPSPLDTSGGN